MASYLYSCCFISHVPCSSRALGLYFEFGSERIAINCETSLLLQYSNMSSSSFVEMRGPLSMPAVFGFPISEIASCMSAGGSWVAFCMLLTTSSRQTLVSHENHLTINFKKIPTKCLDSVIYFSLFVVLRKAKPHQGNWGWRPLLLWSLLRSVFKKKKKQGQSADNDNKERGT